MNLASLLIGLVLTHALIWGAVHQMRRDGQRIRNVHLVAFVALELFFGVFLWQAGSWPLFVWMAVNAGVFAVLSKVEPPRRPY